MSIYTSILTGGSNNHETTAEYANGAQTDLIGEGVVGTITNTGGVAPATGGFAVNEQDTPAMAVDVSSGIAYVTATPTGQNSQNLRIRSTATEEVTIAANSTGSTKYDWIYLSVSAANAANPAVDGDNVTTLVTSRSTSISSDDGTPPTYGTLLAKVTVANGASSITDANITDARNNITVPVASVDTEQIVTGAVTPAKLATGATSLGWAEEAGSGTVTTSFVTQASVTATSTGKTVRITYSGFYYNANSGGNRTYDIRLYLDGTTVVKSITGVTLPNVTGASLGHFFHYTFSHTPSAGAHTWAIQALASANSAVSGRNHSIEVREVV